MDINKLTIGEALKKMEESKKTYNDLSVLFCNKEELLDLKNNKGEIDHGFCIVIIDKGFIYVGNLTTDDKFITIYKPKNIRTYSSGKGLLWHAGNGSKDMVLNPYDHLLKAPLDKLIHFIPTDPKLWS